MSSLASLTAHAAAGRELPPSAIATAASVYKGLRSGGAMIEVFGWGNVILGAVVAAVTAAVCVRFLVHWLTRHGLALFAWYRIALAATLAAVTWL